MKNKEKSNKPKLFVPLINYLHTLLTYLLLFCFGITIGISYSSYLKNPGFAVSNYYNILNKVPTLILASTAATTKTVEHEEETILAQNQSVEKCIFSDDEELLDRALEASTSHKNVAELVPKIAFLFLARGSLPLAPLWDKFFRGHDGFFSIYVHSNPFFNETMPKDSVFHGTSIPSKEVDWGKFNMVEAERRLLANALLEPSNQRFVLLSESCIPLFNFSTIYSYLMNSTQTFVDSYDLLGPTGQGRYSRKLKPLVKLHDWRKGSQWFEMDRNLAIEVVSDETYFPRFKRMCRLTKCYGDEHYLATFVSMKFGVKNANMSLTWVDWSRGGHHPMRFVREHVTIKLLKKLRHGNECKYNGKVTNICYLFARKFSIKTLDRLLKFAPKVMSF